MNSKNWRRLHRITNLIFFSASLSIANPVVQQSVREKLQNIPVIKMALINSPGNGHVSMTLTLLRRLEEMDYKGQVEVFYNSEKGLDKFRAMLPQDSLNLRIKFVSYNIQDIDSNPVIPSSLGIIPAIDRGIYPLGTEHNIVVQPYLFAHASVCPSVNGKCYSTDTVQRANIFLNLPEADEDIFKKIQYNLKNTVRRSENTRLKSIITTLQTVASNRKEWDIMPAYGLSQYEGTTKLARVASAILDLYEENNPSLKGKAIIIDFSSFKEDDPTFLRLQKKHEHHILVIDANAPDSQNRILNAPPKSLIILKTGQVPQEIFDYFFQIGNIPGTVAGANALNLVRNLGKPFLMTTFFYNHELYEERFRYLNQRLNEFSNKMGYPQHTSLSDSPELSPLLKNPSLSEETKELISSAHQQFLANEDNTETAALRRFIQEAQIKDSAINRAYREVRATEENDKFNYLLSRLPHIKPCTELRAKIITGLQ